MYHNKDAYMRNLAMRNNVSIENAGSKIEDPITIFIRTMEGIRTARYESVQNEREGSVGLHSTKRSLEVPEKASAMASAKNSVCQRTMNPSVTAGNHQARTTKGPQKKVGKFRSYSSCIYRYVSFGLPICFSHVKLRFV